MKPAQFLTALVGKGRKESMFACDIGPVRQSVIPQRSGSRTELNRGLGIFKHYIQDELMMGACCINRNTKQQSYTIKWVLTIHRKLNNCSNHRIKMLKSIEHNPVQVLKTVLVINCVEQRHPAPNTCLQDSEGVCQLCRVQVTSTAMATEEERYIDRLVFDRRRSRSKNG